MEKKRPIRVLLAKAGLDGHDVGVKVLAYAFRSAGMEVIYTGLHQTPEQIVHAALQEGVDVIGLSILSGAHLPITERVTRLLTESGLNDVLLLVGGSIPLGDVPLLKNYGVAEVFPAHSNLDNAVEFIRKNVH